MQKCYGSGMVLNRKCSGSVWNTCQARHNRQNRDFWDQNESWTFCTGRISYSIVMHPIKFKKVKMILQCCWAYITGWYWVPNVHLFSIHSKKQHSMIFWIIPDPKGTIFKSTVFVRFLPVQSAIKNVQLWYLLQVLSDLMGTEHSAVVFLLQQSSDLLSCKVAERSLFWSKKRVVGASKIGRNQISALGLTNDQWQTVDPGGWAGSRRRVRGCLCRGAQSKSH